MPSQCPSLSRAISSRAGARLAAGVLIAITLAGAPALTQPPAPPVIVKIQDDKLAITEVALPVDAQMHAQPQFVGGMAYGLQVDGKRLTFSAGSARTTVRLDGQNIFPNAPQRPLGAGPRGKPRHGVLSTYVHNNVHVTQVMEVVPGKPSARPRPGQKRQLDTLLVRYTVENKDTRPHSVGVRMKIDTYCWTNDGCLFASPEKFPNRILDGVELKGKDVPDYLQILQIPNLKNPGWVAHFTFRVGRLEAPGRVVLTWHAANDNGWDVPAMQAMGDSDVAFFWDPQELRPGGKRELAYAHGQGIATSPENEGRVHVALGGSFEPGKLFDVTAYVSDPVESQSLALELPPGMECVEGRAVQPVPPAEDGNSIVRWRARVQRLGTFPLRVRSSNGVTYTKLVSISRANGG